MKKFLFLNLKENITVNLIDFMKDYEEVHVNLLNLEKNNIQILSSIDLLKKSKNKNISYYSKKIDNIKLLEDVGHNIHYCWVNNEKFDEDFLEIVNQHTEREFFWILNDNILNFQREEVLSNLKKIKRPICISFTKTLLSENIIQYKKIKEFIKWIQQNWNNTLFNKEKELYVENWVDEKYLSWKDNLYYDTDEKINKNLVMGIFGDIVVSDKDENEKINILNMKKNKECLKCEYFTFCRERGIGLIMKETNLNECISVKFLKNNT